MVRVVSLPVLLTGILGAFSFDTAFAQDGQPSARERELEQLVRQLSARVSQLERRLGALESSDGGNARPPDNDGIETRVGELEQRVDEIKQSAPPSADSEEWARIHQWFADANTMRAYWKDGLGFESMDDSFKLKIGGRIQHDWAFFAEDGNIERHVGDIDDGTEFRRARIYISGTLYDDIEFKVQYDFAGGDVDFKDVYTGFTNLPVVGNVRVGQFKEPFSLEELTSSNYITFMERSLVNTFAPSRNTGLMLHDDMLDKRMTWALGIFRQTDEFGNGTGSRDYNVTARLTGLPWYEDDGEKLLHLGIAYTHQNYEDDVVRFRARPESHLAPRFADTREFSAEYGDIVGAEAALVYGPFSLQGEYAQAFIESRTMDDPSFWAASIQAGYFLTGEHRPYKMSSGTFTRVHPTESVGQEGGLGAWELAARYSFLDLNDARIRGGRSRDFTFGLNWYLNANLRIMWNYVLADAASRGEVSTFQWRLQLAF